MIRVDAAGIVAGVPDDMAVRYLALVQDVGEPMSADLLPKEPDIAVTIGIALTGIFVATGIGVIFNVEHQNFLDTIAISPSGYHV